MNKLIKLTSLGLFPTALSLTTLSLGAMTLGIQQANAGAIIFNTGNAATASIALGVNDEGHLNISDPFGAVSTGNAGVFGVAYKFPDDTWQDATSPGCLCEGWGVSGTLATSGTDHSGYANGNIGIVNLTDLGFVTDAAAGTGTFATSNVKLGDIDLFVTQDYQVATETDALFENKVTITNDTGEDINDLRYVRVMDWDIPTDEFNEYVTILGVTTTGDLERSHDNGFETPNPLVGLSTTPINAGTLNVDFVDNGPADHGAYFLFNFGTLAAGESKEFSIYYGAAPTEIEANAALAAAEIELFSFGQFSGDPLGGTPATYIFGFKGVGGEVVIPKDTPEPTSLLGLILVGALGAGSIRKRSSEN